MALIDKLRFHNILIQGGLPKAPAVDFADALQETFDEQIGALASKADIELILERMDARFRQVDDRFAQVDDQFARIDAQFARVDERFVQMEAHFEARMAQMEKHFEAQMDARFAQMDARFAQSERDAAKRETRQTRLFLIGIGITLTAITLATSLIIALT